jgi:cell division protein FtsL
MKKLFTFIVLTAFALGAMATTSHNVRQYKTKKGTVVKAHRATDADHKKSNNWSHKGNSNPTTGKRGTKR